MVSFRKLAEDIVRNTKLFLCSFILIGAANTATADIVPDQRTSEPFGKSRISLELARNFPEGATPQYLAPGNYEPVVTYFHVVNSDWMMGLSAGLKVFDRLESPNVPTPSRTLSVYNFSHETLHITRLSHPYYLLSGIKLSYLLPSITGTPPPQRDTVYQSEIGIGLTAQIMRSMGDRLFLMLRLDLWRGVNTSKLSGLEVATGIGAVIN